MGRHAFKLRPGREADAHALAQILRQGQIAAVPDFPVLHTPQEDEAFLRAKVLAATDVTVATVSGQAVGFVSMERTWIGHLYIAQPFWRAGIGTALVEHAKSQSDRLELFTFQANAGARAFYADKGFREVAYSDGSANEERLPDVRLLWERAADASFGACPD